MLRHLRVLFPTDFSAHAEIALPYALALVKRFSGELCIAHVIDTNALAHGSGQGFWLGDREMRGVLDSIQEHVESRLAVIVDRAADMGIKTTSLVLRGQPVPQILEAARVCHADMIVLPSHGRSGIDRLVFGSVCERVIRHSPAPVLAIKHPEHEFIGASDLELKLNHVMFPTDFSEHSLKGLPYAVSLCREFGATLLLTHVAEIPLILPELLPELTDGIDTEQVEFARKHLEAMAKSIPDVTCEINVRRGHPPLEITDLATERDVDLIVIPTHGRSGILHVFWGSVTEKVMRLAPCPVLTLRPEGHRLELESTTEAGREGEIVSPS